MPRLGGDDGGSGGFSRALQKPVDAVTDMFWGIVNFGKFKQDRKSMNYKYFSGYIFLNDVEFATTRSPQTDWR